MEEVILVDESDNPVGTMEKMSAHEKGILHRAFSIVIFNSSGQMLLQKRAGKKYHSAGLWTNTCCSHPAPSETMEQATIRKLEQEMGIQTPLTFAYKFTYKARLENGLTEHEMDYVFTGLFDGMPKINPEEVADYRFVEISDLQDEIRATPKHFTPWFKLIMEDLPAVMGTTRR